MSGFGDQGALHPIRIFVQQDMQLPELVHGGRALSEAVAISNHPQPPGAPFRDQLAITALQAEGADGQCGGSTNSPLLVVPQTPPS